MLTSAHRSKRAIEISVLAAPIIVAMLIQTSINVVDTIFVGKLPASVSVPGQAALGLSLPLLWAFGGSLAAFGIGTQVIAARRDGEGARDQAGGVLLNAIALSGALSLAVTLFAWIAIPSIFAFLTPDEAVRAAGIPYARVRILGVVSLVLTTVYKGFFDGLGQTRAHMWAAIVMNAANVALNYALIFGAGPLPALGVTGAAVASLASTFIGLVILIAWSRSRTWRAIPVYALGLLSRRTSWELVKLSAPSAAAQLFIMSGVLLFLKIIGALDARAIEDLRAALAETSLPSLGLASCWGAALAEARPAVFTAAAKLIIDLLSIGFVTCIAFGTATSTLVSRALGRSEPERAADYGWDSVLLAALIFGALGALAVAFPRAFLDVLSDDPWVIETAVPGLRIMAGLEMFVATSLVLTQALFGAGATRYVMVVEFVLHGVCLAPLAYLFGVYFDLGFLGVWYAGSVYIVALACAMGWKFAGGSWASIKV